MKQAWLQPCSFSILLVSLTLPALAQQQGTVVPAVQPGSGGTALPVSNVSRDRQIKLDVVVTDRSGNVIPHLLRQDFILLDNKQPKPILSFESRAGSTQTATPATIEPDAPVEVILVVDEVNTSFSRVSYERNEIKAFLSRNGGKLTQPVSLVLFTDTGTEVQNNPSSDGNGLVTSLDQSANKLRTIRRSTGIYGAEERLALSLNMLKQLAAKEATRPGRKLVVWISPGWPLLSGPRIDLSSTERQRLFDSIVQVSAALRRARITLYSVDPLGVSESVARTTYYEEFLKGVTRPNDAQIGNLALQVLATQSGGLAIYGSNSIQAGIDHCVADASAYYVLSMDPAPADKPNAYHAIEVKLETPGLKARTRAGYYAEP